MAASSRKVFGLALVASLASGVAHAAPDPIEAVTRPSVDITLSFLEAGKIQKVDVKQGDHVHLNGLLVHLDDAADVIHLGELKGMAETQVKVRMAQATLEQKSVQLEHLERASASNAVSPLELSRARLDVSLAELGRSQENFEHEQAGSRYREAQVRLQRMALVSPIDGLVEELFVHDGQIIDRLEKVVRLVSIDPLWVDVSTPVALARGLKVGGSATLDYRDGAPATGKLVDIRAFADAGSDTLKVRIEVPNHEGRPAGEHVKVRFASGTDAK